MKKQNIKENAIILYTKRKNVSWNVIDNLINYCSDNKLKIIKACEIVQSSNTVSKEFLFDILNYIKSQKGRIHIVCIDYNDILQDTKNLPILESLITAGKIIIHILRQNYTIDKSSNDVLMMARIYALSLVKNCNKMSLEMEK